MEYSQVVRHRFLVPACKGSNPFTPDYEHPIGSVKNELADDYRGSLFQARNPSPACSKPKVLLFSTFFAKRRERKERQMAESNPSNQPTCGVEHNTNFGQVLPQISWPLLNSLFRKSVAGWSDRTPDTREPSPGGMHGSLALHGTKPEAPSPSNLTLHLARPGPPAQ